MVVKVMVLLAELVMEVMEHNIVVEEAEEVEDILV